MVAQLGNKDEAYYTSYPALTKSLYYTVACAGHSFWRANVHTKRDRFDSLLILHVLNGSFTYLREDGKHITATKGQSIILNCYVPHEYYTADALESLWIHIEGANCRAFYAPIRSHTGDVIGSRDAPAIRDALVRCFLGVRDGAEVSVLSLEVYTLLLRLLSTSPDVPTKEKELAEVKAYISGHLGEPLHVEEMARLANMSTSHFSRVFRQQTGFSPYEYVLTARLNKAKEYLHKTDLSISQIAYATGFNSEANFVYRFSRSTGVSPGRFRKLRL